MMTTSKIIVFFLLLLYFTFLTFKDLISIDIGFVVRVPHLLIGLCFIIILLYSLSGHNKLKLKYLWALFIVFLVVSILNHSIFNVYFYYILLIIVTSISIFEVLSYFKVSAVEAARLLVLTTLVPIILSYLTITRPWYGGYQIISYSDFSTFFATQLSIIFPFIFYIKKRINRLLIVFVYVITLILLAARGPILALLISYMVFNFKNIRIRTILGLVLTGSFLYAINQNLINYYLSKLNPYSENYAALSDLNRWAYILATLSYLPSVLVVFIGNGIKYNKTIIYDYFAKGGFSFTPLDDATVHNIFLEIYSDYGIIIVFCVLFYMLYIFISINRLVHPDKQPFLISITTFFINYNLEPNYVHYFFWTMLAFYYYGYNQLKINSIEMLRTEYANSYS